MAEGSKYVWIVGKPVKALEEPVFIIKRGTVYYVTKAVWEYNKAEANTQSEKDGCDKIADDFENAKESVEAKFWVPKGVGGGPDGQQTDPG